MKSNTECWKPRFVGLVIVMSFLSVCATVDSERVVGTCPPLVKYDAAYQAKAAEEALQFPEDSVLVEMMADYALLRDQVRACIIL